MIIHDSRRSRPFDIVLCSIFSIVRCSSCATFLPRSQQRRSTRGRQEDKTIWTEVKYPASKLSWGRGREGYPLPPPPRVRLTPNGFTLPLRHYLANKPIKHQMRPINDVAEMLSLMNISSSQVNKIGMNSKWWFDLSPTNKIKSVKMKMKQHYPNLCSHYSI